MVGDINRDGRDEVVVQNPFNLYVGIFEWDLRAQLSLVSQVYNRVPAPDGQTAWVLSGADQMQIACPGAHIFAFNHADGYMGVFEWRLTGLTCIWSANNQIASPPAPWQVDNQTKYLVIPGTAGSAVSYLLAYKSATNSLGILIWSPIQSSLQILASPASDYNSGWNVSSSARFVVDNSGSLSAPTIFVCDGNFGAISLWASPNQTITIASESSFPVPAWSPTLMASAPSTTFPTYTPAQSAIYAYISQQIPLPNPVSDIRALYTNSAYAVSFPTWALSVENLAMPENKGWAPADWDVVQQGLSAELYNVGYVWGWYTGVYDTFWTDVIGQQKLDLSTVTAAIEQTQAVQTATYWNQQVFVAVIWGLAALPPLSTLAVPLAMTASLMGSALGAPGSSPDILIGQLKDRIDNASASNLFKYQSELTAIVTDPVKLRILSALVEKQWAVQLDSFSSQKTAISAANRLSFYQALFPGVFSIQVYPNCGSNYADDLNRYEACPYDKAYCHYAVANTANPGNYDVYLLFAKGSLGAVSFPTQDLVTDLFTNLNISKDIFFMGYSGWNDIPRYTSQLA
jgi:hypothetical protein